MSEPQQEVHYKVAPVRLGDIPVAQMTPAQKAGLRKAIRMNPRMSAEAKRKALSLSSRRPRLWGAMPAFAIPVSRFGHWLTIGGKA